MQAENSTEGIFCLGLGSFFLGVCYGVLVREYSMLRQELARRVCVGFSAWGAFTECECWTGQGQTEP